MPSAKARARVFALFFGEISAYGVSSTTAGDSSTDSTPSIPRLPVNLWMSEPSGRGPGGDDTLAARPRGDQSALAVEVGADRPGDAQSATLDLEHRSVSPHCRRASLLDAQPDSGVTTADHRAVLPQLH